MDKVIFLPCELSEYVCSVMSDVSNNCKEVLKLLLSLVLFLPSGEVRRARIQGALLC